MRNPPCDAIQMPVETLPPRVAYEHLVATYPEEKLIKILTYIALHPEEGMVITDISDLGIEGRRRRSDDRARTRLPLRDQDGGAADGKKQEWRVAGTRACRRDNHASFRAWVSPKSSRRSTSSRG